MGKEDKNKQSHSNAEKPISLKPLKFDEAVSDLLKVKPEIKEHRQKGNVKPLKPK